jgi:hypothetical protein
MKLGFQLLNNSATLNTISVIRNQKINQGEALNIVFQLIDKDQNGVRFIPSAAATCLVEIARFPDVMATGSNQRVQVDYSVRRQAAMLLPNDDRSIWTVPLTSYDTANMMSSNMRVTITDGNNTWIAVLSMAIVCTRSELDPEPSPGSPYIPGVGP